jgi:4-hydroxy-3-polyprenylbenzoate decarboxylase/2,5-furandicarboxylate decarboxylase 1
VPYADFRAFLDVLRAHGELIDVERRVDPYLEVGKALRKTAAIGGPAINFKNNGTAFPLVGGLYNSRSKALLAFESSESDVFERILAGLAQRVAPRMCAGQAPAHDVVLTGPDADLTKLPIPTYSPDDGGPFITPGIVVSNDPETGVPDMGHYRFQILGPDTMSFLAQPFHRFGKHIVKARALGMTKYAAAIVLGVEPILAYTCTIQVPDGTNDFEVAGGLRGAPVELARARTIDVDVPAHSEIVIEFEADLTTDVPEGPLGEYTGYYTPVSLKPLARVTAITHRRDAYCQALLTGIPPTENHILKQLPFEASFFASMRKQFPTLHGVAIPPSGGVSFYIVMAMTPRYAGEARHAILAAMATNLRPKTVIVVDPDINVHSSAEVEWAVAFRSQPHRDAIVVEGLPAGPLDPSADDSLPLDSRTASAMGIDATRPFGQPFQKVADVPGWQAYDFPELRGPA